MYLKSYKLLVEQLGMTEGIAIKALEHYKVVLHSVNKCYLDEEDIKFISEISKFLLTNKKT